MTQIAFLGTGLLGSGFVHAALGRGEPVTVWNRTIEKARALEAEGARVAESPAEAVRGATRVHLVLKDDAVVAEVIAQARPGLGADAIIVDHTTTQPRATAERAKRLAAEGVRYLHCPVFIGPAAARQGHGTILSSGPRALFDSVQGALARMAERVDWLGEREDLAAAAKLCGNAYILGIGALVADVLSIAAGAGVDPEVVVQTIERFDIRTSVAGRLRRMTSGDWSPSFELAMARKDLRLMIETAEGQPLAALPMIAARMDDLIAEGHGADDVSVIGRHAARGS